MPEVGEVMNHHRCTRCKQESYPRHKYASGLFCESCLRELGVHGFRRFSFWKSVGGIFSEVSRWLSSPFRTKKQTKLELKQAASRTKVSFKAAQSRMMRIPGNAAAGVPQKK